MNEPNRSRLNQLPHGYFVYEKTFTEGGIELTGYVAIDKQRGGGLHGQSYCIILQGADRGKMPLNAAGLAYAVDMLHRYAKKHIIPVDLCFMCKKVMPKSRMYNSAICRKCANMAE